MDDKTKMQFIASLEAQNRQLKNTLNMYRAVNAQRVRDNLKETVKILKKVESYGIVFDNNGMIRVVGDRAISLLGYGSDEISYLEGKDFSFLFNAEGGAREFVTARVPETKLIQLAEETMSAEGEDMEWLRADSGIIYPFFGEKYDSLIRDEVRALEIPYLTRVALSRVANDIYMDMVESEQSISLAKGKRKSERLIMPPTGRGR